MVGFFPLKSSRLLNFIFLFIFVSRKIKQERQFNIDLTWLLQLFSSKVFLYRFCFVLVCGSVGWGVESLMCARPALY